MAKSRLHQLADHGQSVWIDYLSRDLLKTGKLERMMREDAVAGVTSNPTIFQKAITAGDAYDEQLREVLEEEQDPKEVFLRLAAQDVVDACDLLRRVWERESPPPTKQTPTTPPHNGVRQNPHHPPPNGITTWGHHRGSGRDGYVSIEVDPHLAYDTEATVGEAKRLHALVERPNLLVKIPATKPGLPAIEDMIAKGKSINVTLTFSLGRYAEVAEAYVRGLERLVAAGGDPRRVASVASFFVSRVDTEADRRLDEIGGHDDLKGKLAVANAKLVYQRYKEIFSGERWEFLLSKGASPQRCLWASTSTKNPAYSDVLYVEELIGPGTVNTMPEETIRAFQDHGKVVPTLERGIDEAKRVFERLAEAGVDYDDVTETLEREGVDKFAASFDELLEGLQVKCGEVMAA